MFNAENQAYNVYAYWAQKEWEGNHCSHVAAFAKRALNKFSKKGRK